MSGPETRVVLGDTFDESKFLLVEVCWPRDSTCVTYNVGVEQIPAELLGAFDNGTLPSFARFFLFFFSFFFSFSFSLGRTN